MGVEGPFGTYKIHVASTKNADSCPRVKQYTCTGDMGKSDVEVLNSAFLDPLDL